MRTVVFLFRQSKNCSHLLRYKLMRQGLSPKMMMSNLGEKVLESRSGTYIRTRHAPLVVWTGEEL